jgi:exopolysaccharide biosynthesis polyprenyl glycosylphosphotransferase
MSGLICIAAILHFGALWAWRWRLGEDSFGRTERRNVLIIGATAAGQGLANSIAEQPGSCRRVCGFLDDEIALDRVVIGRVSDLARIARTEFVDEVIVAGPHDQTRIPWVVDQARKLQLDIHILPEFFGCNPPSEDIERIGDFPVICLHEERLPTLALFVKRVVDIAVAAAALTALFPILASIAALIKLDSSGPVFYCAPRAGRKGQLFRCFKFRTMVRNADELKLHLRRKNQRAGPFFKIPSDPRITRIGRYLRRYSLDELPQLWNVIRGEMSLVGPRPHPLDDIAGYEIEHLGRLDVVPGMTGLWQVTARRDPSFERGMELDRQYIRTWSLRLDAEILVKTMRAVLMGSGD